jgi:hypothetical protein
MPVLGAGVGPVPGKRLGNACPNSVDGDDDDPHRALNARMRALSAVLAAHS